MKVTKVQQKLRKIPQQPAHAVTEPLVSYVVLSAVGHGVAILGMVVGVWLWGQVDYFKPSSHMVTLVEGPLTLEATQAGGDGRSPSKPSKVDRLGEPGEPPPPAPVKAEAAPPAPPLPPTPQAVAEPPKEVLKPQEEAPKEAPKKPPEPKAEAPKEAPKVTETAKKPPEPKAEVAKEESPPPKNAMTLPKPQESKPSPAVQPAPPPSSAAVTEARQAIERLRERQAREAQERAEALRTQQQAVAARQVVEQLRERQTADMQAQQQAAEQRLAALRSRFGSGGTGGGTGSGGPDGSGPGGGAGGLGGGLSRIRLQAYQDLVREKVIGAWILPLPREEARKLQATALLTVSREGQVARLQLFQTSGNSLFDESLLRAIKQASPLPPLPEDYQGEFLEVEMRFRASES
jgi:colicin import membrane protein